MPYTKLAASCIAFFAVALHACPGSAQTLRGRVVADGGQRQIPNVQVSILPAEGDSVVAASLSEDGSFVIALAEAGAYRLRVEALGYRTVVTEVVRVANGAVVTLEVRMRVDAIPLEPLQVVAERIEPPFMRDIRDRQRMGFGRMLSREDLDQRSGSKLDDVLRDAGLWVEYVPHGPRQVPLVRGRVSGARELRGELCYSALYVNGVRQFPSTLHPTGARQRLADGSVVHDEVALERVSELFEFRPQDVEAIEIYRARNETPALFADPGSECGVVAVWLRSGYEASVASESSAVRPLEMMLRFGGTSYHITGPYAPRDGAAIEAAAAWKVLGPIAMGLRLAGGVHTLPADVTAELLRGKDPTLYDVEPGPRSMTLLHAALESQFEPMRGAPVSPVPMVRLIVARRSFTVARPLTPARKHSLDSYGLGYGVALGVNVRLWDQVALHASAGHDWLHFESFDNLDTAVKRTAAVWKATSLQLGVAVRP